MVAQAELGGRPNGIDADYNIASPIEPATPQETGPPDSSQVTLPSTEVPASPIESNESFKTEANDDRPSTTVIPSSLTPPPSTQIAPPNGNRRAFSYSQQSNLASPPATILQTIRDRDLSSDYTPPTPHQVLEAPADELRAMLQTCIAEQQRLKTETAHYKLQYNLLSLQSEEDAKRAAVEHEMNRREVDALRMAEQTRQAKRELSAASEASHVKYLQMKSWFDEAMEENETLHHRVKAAKKLIQQKEEENMALRDDSAMLLTRIRENREHFRMLCSPGGMYHGVTTPKHQAASPQQHRGTPRQANRSTHRDERDHGEHGLSALLQAMSQDNNNSAPSTPATSHRAAPRQTAKHSRNAQSLSSLPTTPMHRPRGEYASLLPSADLVPQTEPPRRFVETQFVPQTPNTKPGRRRKSRESTISEGDNVEELARQALESAAAVHSFASQASRPSRGGDDEDVFDSQASQAATELLRRDPRQSFEVASSAGSRDGTPAPMEKTARMQAKLFAGARGGGDKRKFSGSHEVRRGQASPQKVARFGPQLSVEEIAGLGIAQGLE